MMKQTEPQFGIPIKILENLIVLRCSTLNPTKGVGNFSLLFAKVVYASFFILVQSLAAVLVFSFTFSLLEGIGMGGWK